MNPELAFEIVELALGLLKYPDEALDTIVQLILKAKDAYYEHAGKPLDPFSITAETAI
jgi:hypothetical protein